MLQISRTPIQLWIKGIKNGVLARPMVQFLLHSPIAIEFREWLEDTKSPEEYFFATLIRVEVDQDSGELVGQDLSPTRAENRDMCSR